MPEVATPSAMKVGAPRIRTLGNGLVVWAVRKPGIPLVQLRLVLPTSRARTGPGERARQRVLARALQAGTRHHTQAELAGRLQGLGGGLAAGADAEDLSLSGSALSTNLAPLLDMVREVLTEATFPATELAIEQRRLQEELAMAASQPSTVARLAVTSRVYGAHPYGDPLPTPEDVGAVTRAQLAAFMRTRTGPAAGHLVLVGDVPAGRLLDAAEVALGGWSSGAPAQPLPAPPPFEPGPLVLVDRPGSVQTSIRLVGPALPRQHPDAAALALALTIFGGSFSSRLNANLREDKGWTYSPQAGIEHLQAASLLTVSAEVATEVTAPSLVEIAYELGRMATLPVTGDELEAARRFRTGSTALSLQTQSGLASQLVVLASTGLDVAWLAGMPGRFAAVTVEDVLRVSRRHLGPGRLVTVLVGDASHIRGEVEALGEVRPEA
ncbi:MAG: pitrilysin family protein [Acidimicrobiales bacterium]